MDLATFVSQFEGIRLASPRDNDELLEFFHVSQLRGQTISLVYDRRPDFFDFLRLHSSDHFVICYRNRSGKISGVGTLVLRSGFREGKITKVCYLGDLRLSFDRHAARVWRSLYSALMRERERIQEFAGVSVFYTCLIDENMASFRNLVGAKNADFEYREVAPYRMVNLFCLVWPRLRVPPLSCRPAVTEDLESILDFYRKNEAEIRSGYLYSTDLPRRLKSWPDFAIEDFILVENKSDIIAVAAIWSPRKVKKIVLSNAPWWMRKWTREGELHIAYLTHRLHRLDGGEDERRDALAMLLASGWRLARKKGYRFLAYAEWPGDPSGASRRFLSYRVPMKIYEVCLRGTEPPSKEIEYGFEMALV